MKSHHIKISVIVAVLLAIMVLVLLLDAPESKDEPVSSLPHYKSTPFGVYSPGSLAEVPTSAALKMITALELESLEEYEDYSIEIVREMGASWVRIDFLFDGWTFDEPEYVGRLQQNGIEVVGCARPLNRFAPADLAVFEDELRRLVERYPSINVWQIGNEPNYHWAEDDYVRLFLSGQRVVREACPSCRIALGGIAARVPSQEGALAYYDRLLAGITRGFAGEGPPFDIFDMHFYGYYGDYLEMNRALSGFMDLTDKYGVGSETAYWVTETSTTSGQPSSPETNPGQSEEQQAAELVRRFVVMLATGVERIAWARPYENYRYGEIYDGYYDHNALVYNGLGEEAAAGVVAGTRKQAFAAYRTLADKVSGFGSTRKLAPGKFSFDFADGRPSVYVLWGSGTEGLPPEISGPVLVTTIIGTETIVDAGALNLGETPVYVELD